MHHRPIGREPPLRFFTSTRKWDPDSDSLDDQVFTGFFEKDSKGSAEYWFENRNESPVAVQLKSVSCSSCSDGWLAPLPPETTRGILQMSAISCLPMGPISFLPVGMAGLRRAPDGNERDFDSLIHCGSDTS